VLGVAIALIGAELQKPIHATASHQKILHLLTRLNLYYSQIRKGGHPLKPTGNRANMSFIVSLHCFEFCLHSVCVLRMILTLNRSFS
jgi:hypothetical protein